MSSNSTLFEIASTFDVLDALQASGWKLSRLRLFGRPRRLQISGERGLERIKLTYQHTPRALAEGSIYADRLAAHHVGVDWVTRRPDLAVELMRPTGVQFILVEMKFGVRRSTSESARAALADLLSYRREFDETLKAQKGPTALASHGVQGFVPAKAKCFCARPN